MDGVGVGLDVDNCVDMLTPGKPAAAVLQLGDKITEWNGVAMFDPATGERRLLKEVVTAEGETAPGLPGGRVRVVSSTRALSALRRMQQGKPYKGNPVDAVLVDDTSWEGLQQLKRFKGVFRVLYASSPLPTAPVVSFRDVPESESKRLGEVLGGMKSDDEGRKILKTLQATGFAPPQREALAGLVARYEGKEGSK